MYFLGSAVGLILLIGGLSGLLLGSKISQYYKNRNVQNAYFLIPAIFAIISTITLFIVINTKSKGACIVFLVLFDITVFTNVSPITTLALNSIPPLLRSRGAGIALLIQHIFGTIIAPPIIGYVSDSAQSLMTALQLTWIAVAISCFLWFCGYYFVSNGNSRVQLEPQIVPSNDRIIEEAEDGNRRDLVPTSSTTNELSAVGTAVVNNEHKIPLKFSDILCTS